MGDEKIRTVVVVSPGRVADILDLPDYPSGGFQEAIEKAFAAWATTSTVSDPREVIAIIGDAPVRAEEYRAMMIDLQRLGYQFSFMTRRGDLTARIEALEMSGLKEKPRHSKPLDYLKHDPSKRHSRRGRGRRHERPFE